MFIKPLKIDSITLENNLMLAPLAGITDMLLRVIAKRHGCGLVFSEMLNSNGVLKGGVKMLRKMDIDPAEHPAGIQIAGDDPTAMAEVAKIAQAAGAKLLNINMGCPAKKVTKSQAGCALMRHPQTVKNIIHAVKKAIDIPLTVKIRLGWDEQNKNYLEIAKIAQEEGCAFVIMHARTRVQAFKGQAKWEEIKILKDNLSIPVIGNGDITSAKKAFEMFEQTGCDGIMIGRGALGKPWLFEQILHTAQNKTFVEPEIETKKNIIIEHFNESVARYGTHYGVTLMRKHFCWYSHGLRHSAKFRKEINQLENPKEIIYFINDFFDQLKKDSSFELKQKVYDLPSERPAL